MFLISIIPISRVTVRSVSATKFKTPPRLHKFRVAGLELDYMNGFTVAVDGGWLAR